MSFRIFCFAVLVLFSTKLYRTRENIFFGDSVVNEPQVKSRKFVPFAILVCVFAIFFFVAIFASPFATVPVLPTFAAKYVWSGQQCDPSTKLQHTCL